jgi:adenylosuccinate synthase
MLKELDNLTKNGIDYTGRLKISNRAHVLFDFHQLVDGRQEDALKGEKNWHHKKRYWPLLWQQDCTTGCKSS